MNSYENIPSNGAIEVEKDPFEFDFAMCHGSYFYCRRARHPGYK